MNHPNGQRACRLADVTASLDIREQLGHGFQAEAIEVEQAMLLNADTVAPALERLKARGIGLALDDFGVGY